MANPRTKVVYIMDNGTAIVIKVPSKYVTLGGFQAPANGTTYGARPDGLRLRHANLMTHIPDSVAGTNQGHNLERKVPCNVAALATGQPLALGGSVTNLDGTGDPQTYIVNGWTGERKKNI